VYVLGLNVRSNNNYDILGLEFSSTLIVKMAKNDGIGKSIEVDYTPHNPKVKVLIPLQ
jgi:hypothetical protein